MKLQVQAQPGQCNDLLRHWLKNKTPKNMLRGAAYVLKHFYRRNTIYLSRHPETEMTGVLCTDGDTEAQKGEGLAPGHTAS